MKPRTTISTRQSYTLFASYHPGLLFGCVMDSSLNFFTGKPAVWEHEHVSLSQLFERRIRHDLTSLLGSLPVVKPGNIYWKDSNSRPIYSWSDTDKQDKRKSLCFLISRIDTETVQFINTLILNEAHGVQEIVYRCFLQLKFS